jgi:hypothetical protein
MESISIIIYIDRKDTMIFIKKSLVLLLCFFVAQPILAMQRTFSAAYESARGIVRQDRSPIHQKDKQKFSAAYESAANDSEALKIAAWIAKQQAQKKEKREKEYKAMLDDSKRVLAPFIAEQKKEQEFFADIKTAVEKSAFRMKDWTKAATLTEQEMIQATNCHNAALALFKAMTANAYFSFTHHPPNNRHNHYGGSYGRFCAKNSWGKFAAPVAQKLFASSSEHLVFYVQIGRIDEGYQPNHSFVVEKLRTRDERKYRIYQSFYKGFTLAQWIGVDKWPQKKWAYKNTCLSDFFDKSHARYGNGRKVTEDELHAFIVANLYIREYCKTKPSDYYPSAFEYIMPPYFSCGIMQAADKITHS